MTIELTTQLNALENGDTCLVTVNFYCPAFGRDNTGIAILHKGFNYWYLQPSGDAHPGASITKQDIISIRKL